MVFTVTKCAFCIGSRHVEALVQSVNATTHSFTVMPILSAAGELFSPLFVVLQESRGLFGPRVTKNLFRPSNLQIECSTSGLMHKDHWKLFLDVNFFPHAPNHCTLLYDSWTTASDTTIVEDAAPAGKTVDVKIIPPKVTAILQPLDVYYLRMFKDFQRKFSDRVVNDKIDMNLYERNNVLKF